jgi:hypothetical protein
MDAQSYIYGEQLSELNDSGIQCPPLGASSLTLDAWRWVANPITENCFHPVAVRNPPRLLKEDTPSKVCSCWGLSMYLTLDQSVLAFKYLEKNFKMARKRLGDHVACISITPTHGVCSAADRHGHFDLHPYATANLNSSVSGVSPIP